MMFDVATAKPNAVVVNDQLTAVVVAVVVVVVVVVVASGKWFVGERASRRRSRK